MGFCSLQAGGPSDSGSAGDQIFWLSKVTLH
jgi:hypothetical protein